MTFDARAEAHALCFVFSVATGKPQGGLCHAALLDKGATWSFVSTPRAAVPVPEQGETPRGGR